MRVFKILENKNLYDGMLTLTTNFKCRKSGVDDVKKLEEVKEYKKPEITYI